MVLSIAAAVLLALNLTIVWPFTQPANATQDWTVQPDNGQALRT